MLGLSDDLLLKLLSPLCVTRHYLLKLVCHKFNALVSSEAFLLYRRRNSLAQHALVVYGGQNHDKDPVVGYTDTMGLICGNWVHLAKAPNGCVLCNSSAMVGQELFLFGAHRHLGTCDEMD